jgi:hypothetical protein
MVRKCDVIHPIQSEDREEIELATHSLELACRFACTRLEKSSADRFTASHDKHSACQISLPTFQHTRFISTSDWSLRANHTAKQNFCCGLYGSARTYNVNGESWEITNKILFAKCEVTGPRARCTIILRLIFKKCGLMAWTLFKLFRIGLIVSDGLLWTRHWTFGFHGRW